MFRLAALLTLVSWVGCDDPKNPQTWIKKLRDPKNASKAVRELKQLGDPVAIKPLCELFKDFESPEILKPIISLMKKDPTNKAAEQTLITALEFTEDKYHNATLAANAIAKFKIKAGVIPLAKVLDRQMSIKSRGPNKAKQAAIAALGKLGDPRAVPYLVRTLERRPERQDFLHNKAAARALGKIGHATPEVISVLIRALFMSSTIQGTAFPMARVSLVQLGKPVVPAVIAAMNGKDEKLYKMSKELKFVDGVILSKTSRILGDLMAKEAVDPLLKALNEAKLLSDDYTTGIDGVIEALGRIGDPRAEEPLLRQLNNKRVDYKLRMQICRAFTIMGSKKALPTLLELSGEKGSIDAGGVTGATNLREQAATTYGQIVGAEVIQGWPVMEAIVKDPKLKDYKETKKNFQEALNRMKVAKDCKDDAVCYGKKVNDKKLSLVQRQKAGIMIGILPNGRSALPALIKALPEREPTLRLYFLESAKRIGKASDKGLVDVITRLAAKDSKRRIKFMGADLASADYVALGVISKKK